MNKIIQITVAGQLFSIEDSAYENLNQYLKSLKTKFSKDDNSAEIIQDLQNRMAELLAERQKSRGFISETDIQNIRKTLGEAKEIEDEAETEYEYYREETVSKRLFRDKEKGSLGGVCAGLGEYFGVDVILFRLIFLIGFFVFGSGFLIYFVLWIVMPEARTAKDRLSMKGKKPNWSNIEEQVKREATSFKKKIDNFSSSADFKSSVKRGKSTLEKLIRGMFKLVFSAFWILFLGILLVSIYGIWFGSVQFSGMDNPMNALNYVWLILHGNPGYKYFMWGLTLVLLLPAAWLAIKGLGRLFKFSYPRYLTNGIGLAWVIIFLIFAGFVGTRAVEYSVQNEFSERKALGNKNSYRLNMKKNDELFNNKSVIGKEEYQVPWFNSLKIVSTDNEDAHLLIKRNAMGRNNEKAFFNTTTTDNTLFSLNDSTIELKNHLSISKSNTFKFQRVNFILQIPKGKQVMISKRIYPMLKNGYGKYAGHTVINNNGTIECVDCLD